MTKKEVDIRQLALVVVSVLFYIFVVLSISILSDSSVMLVFVGTLPFLLYLFVFFYIVNKQSMTHAKLWLIPLLFPILFFILWRSGAVALVSKMEGPTLTVLNLFLSYVINILLMMVFILFSSGEKKHKKKEEKITEENFNVSLRSIEDKCKSLNFVIGRVYSNRKGGTKEIRSTLKIDSKWYNAFSRLSQDLDKEDTERVVLVLNMIYQKLLGLENREKDMFKLDKFKAIEIERDAFGNDKVIDVLIKNDSDPVESYHKEAKEVCLRTIEYLKSMRKP